MFAKMRAVLDELLIVLKLLRVLLRWLAFGLAVRPRGLGKRVQLNEEFSVMGQVFTYRQGLLPAPSGIATQRLTVTVDGVAQEPISVEGEATSVDFKAGPAGASVTLSLEYLDAAGNDSDNFETTFVVVDGIPPEAPAGFGEVVQLAEEFVADEVPVDVPEDVPADESTGEDTVEVTGEDLPL